MTRASWMRRACDDLMMTKTGCLDGAALLPSRVVGGGKEGGRGDECYKETRVGNESTFLFFSLRALLSFFVFVLSVWPWSAFSFFSSQTRILAGNLWGERGRGGGGGVGGRRARGEAERTRKRSMLPSFRPGRRTMNIARCTVSCSSTSILRIVAALPCPSLPSWFHFAFFFVSVCVRACVGLTQGLPY